MQLNNIYDLDELLATPEDIYTTKMALLSSFELYLRFMFLAVNNTRITIRPFHDKIIKKLEALVFGENKRRNLCLNLPVGVGKSLIVEYFISWCFARNINNAFMYISHSNTLISRLSNETKIIIESEFWQKLFGFKLKNSERAKVNYSFMGSRNRTGLIGKTMNSAITGLDAGNSMEQGFAGALILDDVIDASDIRSEIVMEDCIYTYSNKLSTRRRSSTTPTILLMQRLAVNDLTGWLLENEPDDWEFVIVPALNEDNTSIWEEKLPAKELLNIMKKNPFKFYSQYQQQPILESGELFKLDWFKFTDEIPFTFDYRFITADIAYKDKEQNDFTVFAYWGVKNIDGKNRLYLIDMKRAKIQALRIESWIVNWIKDKITYGFRYIWVEDKGHGIYLNQAFRERGFPIPNEDMMKENLPKIRDKVERANNILPHIDTEWYNIYINNSIECLTDFKRELATFPNGKHDDTVDVFIDGIRIALFEEDIVSQYERMYG